MCVYGVHIHMYMCVWVHVCLRESSHCVNSDAHVCAQIVEVRRPCCIPWLLYTFLGQNLSLSLELTNLTRLARMRNPGIHIIPPPQLWDYRQVLPHEPFYMGTWIRAQVLPVVQQADSRMNHLPRHSKSPALKVPLDNYFHLVS